MNTNKNKAKTKRNTRERLILAGERLFAERGIDAVSLRQVNVAAGQRNSSASHYHFGSKHALVEAIYEYRMERVNKRRVGMLDAFEREDRLGDVHALVEAVIYPTVDEMWTENAKYYVRFRAQAASHPTDFVRRPAKHSPHREGLRRIFNLLHLALPDLPLRIFQQRFGLMMDHAMHALADRDCIMLVRGEPEVKANEALFTSNLVDSITGALAAQVSTATERELNEAEWTTTRSA